MSYRVMKSMPKGYTERPGLEGPFNFDGRVVYYDPAEGKYWDPRTDFYLSNEEALILYKLVDIS